ncbi:type II toxin-antitoxin system toxin DNA ADP-ribosyl transferase DarT [Saccharothrix coeruleofusca]|uniref:DarT domain-containing protein n=1 Tax=Saccharothrix coeruleofusca TaxID=33919 RepID=A0A918EGN5_9PSEU|nr:DUF4433 domain-containing protein [Saccharothrix coeruleofusca]GGP70169.1 hypothetical protein GCM10010185_48980 [Saccharothrix coeruleofusca]
MAHYRTSGFAAIGSALPQRDRPRDWLVWHFTHIDNLPSIARAGCLRCQNHQEPPVSVALNKVKERRAFTTVAPDSEYPPGKSVADHVPFYIAAKSPMLFVVTRGHHDYSGGDGELVFLGLTIGHIADSGVTWCASDSNAARNFVEFSREVSSLGRFVDFDLLCRRQWNNTPEDPDRSSRRAAEVLVLDRLPLTMISHVVAKEQAVLDKARSILDATGGTRRYLVMPDFYYGQGAR